MSDLTPLDAVVTHHADGFRSGVARFNEILAERLGVPLLRIADDKAQRCNAPLLSFKLTEMDEAELALVEGILTACQGRGQLFLHAWGDSTFEREAVTKVERVVCGNSQIQALIDDLAPTAALWAPGLILDRREFPEAEISVFSFGMAHKIRSERFLRLRELLEVTGRSYALYISSANHETTTMQEAQSVYEDMAALFPDELYFMGNLSDVTVYNQLRSTTFFASFFPDGLRANNTSVNAALDLGAVVITNLDEHSPAHLVHMENLIDIDSCESLPTDPADLARIGSAAREAAAALGWDPLVSSLQER